MFPGVVLAALLAYGLVIGERLMPRGGTDIVQVEARRANGRGALPIPALW
ncbi:MAG: hypothetical protein ACK4RZ_06755 [Paracoccaceae bacterium]